MTTYPATFEQPTTDSLTGLVSSSYFRHLLRDELVPHSQTSGDPLAIGLFDIDDFLQVNSVHGHRRGDETLLLIAAVVRDSLPEQAVLARYGGDEFAMALPDTRLDDAFTVAEEFRRRAADRLGEEFADMQLTCSIGLAAFPGNGGNDVELLRAADQALYVAKSTGRNKVSLPLADSRMITKTSHYTATQLERLSNLARAVKRNEASILREALDDVLKKHNDQLDAARRADAAREGIQS